MLGKIILQNSFDIIVAGHNDYIFFFAGASLLYKRTHRETKEFFY